jgi:hypothetical protein
MDVSNHDKGITSVKVHHQPGGQSSFSLAHEGAVDDRFSGNNGKIGQRSAAPQGAPGFKSTEEQKKESPDSGPGAFTSVKYSGQPPGGKSSGPLW